ncbi:hypothetical protein HH195_04985 [Sarcina sp. JB2]|uniref:Uncharacterized protein n=1 Tax=Candidatus Sarcina troglodytae TaxID=2726954 RepID=A0ACD1BD05_9CLOT|nr:ATP-binding protein [Sarcina sp. JB2]QPJ85303.1 hypothetical protein HH195_04985 [Sarcina sp. JB2]
METNRILIDKNFLRKTLTEKEDVLTSLCQLIDNSIQAYDKLTYKRDNICNVKIKINKNYIIVQDNSGGIEKKVTDEEIFKIGNTSLDEFRGVGLKKAILKLGNTVIINSNRADFSCKIQMSIKNWKAYDWSYTVEEEEYNNRLISGTRIEIKALEDIVKKEICNDDFETNLIKKLGKIYKQRLKNNKLNLILNNINVNPVVVKGSILTYKKANFYNEDLNFSLYIKLYKAFQNEANGMDLYINDDIVFNRNNTKLVKWNYLKEPGHSYKNCVVEVIINSEEPRNKVMTNMPYILQCVIKFIKQNNNYFVTDKISIQFEKDAKKIEALKEYFGDATAKEVGSRAFDYLYVKYLDYISNEYKNVN